MPTKEFFDIIDEKGNKTGVIKERILVHRDGDLHAASHIWIARKNPETNETEVLLQLRSSDKDSHPSCFDTSCAGHLSAGDTYEQGALRELYEELGIKAEVSELEFLFKMRTSSHNIFYGKPFNDNQINKVYLLKRDVDINDITPDPAEIRLVKWQSYNEVSEKLRNGDKHYCTNPEEFEALRKFLQF
ncbi:MAG: NUDIX domain-containing protein [Clostridiales bacterium]|nr:NUDIX domain-containing protein [Clostridiales bacterium]